MRVHTKLDLRSRPVELFNGFQPDALVFDPSGFGFARYPSFDLLAATKPDRDRDVYEAVAQLVKWRVYLPDRDEFQGHGASPNAAVCWQPDGAWAIAVLYTFSEVSADHYMCFVHFVAEVGPE